MPVSVADYISGIIARRGRPAPSIVDRTLRGSDILGDPFATSGGRRTFVTPSPPQVLPVAESASDVLYDLNTAGDGEGVPLVDFIGDLVGSRAGITPGSRTSVRQMLTGARTGSTPGGRPPQMRSFATTPRALAGPSAGVFAPPIDEPGLAAITSTPGLEAGAGRSTPADTGFPRGGFDPADVTGFGRFSFSPSQELGLTEGRGPVNISLGFPGVISASPNIPIPSTGSRTGDMAAKSFAQAAVKQAASAFGIPTALNVMARAFPASMAFLGPAGLAMGGFQTAVGLGEAILADRGITSVAAESGKIGALEEQAAFPENTKEGLELADRSDAVSYALANPQEPMSREVANTLAMMGKPSFAFGENQFLQEQEGGRQNFAAIPTELTPEAQAEATQEGQREAPATPAPPTQTIEQQARDSFEKGQISREAAIHALANTVDDPGKTVDSWGAGQQAAATQEGQAVAGFTSPAAQAAASQEGQGVATGTPATSPDSAAQAAAGQEGQGVASFTDPGAQASAGQEGQGVSATTSDSAAQAAAGQEGMTGPSDPGGGGGGGGDGGGCFLLGWTFDSRKVGPQERQRQFFRELAQAYLKRYPRTGRREFAQYQAVAKRVIAKVAREAPAVQQRVQEVIFTEVIKPTGAHVDDHEVDATVKRLAAVTLALARRYKVPSPPLSGFMSIRGGGYGQAA